LLKASRFGDFLRSTLSWWRRVKISTSSDDLDRNSPMTAHQISLRISPVGHSIARFAAIRQLDRVYGSDSTGPDRGPSLERLAFATRKGSRLGCAPPTNRRPSRLCTYGMVRCGPTQVRWRAALTSSQIRLRVESSVSSGGDLTAKGASPVKRPFMIWNPRAR